MSINSTNQRKGKYMYLAECQAADIVTKCSEKAGPDAKSCEDFCRATEGAALYQEDGRAASGGRPSQAGHTGEGTEWWV